MHTLSPKQQRATTNTGATGVALKTQDKAYATAAHDTWFRTQVQQALAEADDPHTAWVSHDATKQDMQRQRAALQARILNKAK